MIRSCHELFQNLSFHLEEMRPSYVANCVIHGFSSFTATMLNLVTIYAITKTLSLPKPLKTLLLLSLAVSDLGVGLLVQPFCRGGSRVEITQMFPNLRLLIQRVFIVVQEINYPPCFIVYYEIKQRKKRRISLFRRSHSKPSPSLANSTSLRSHGFVPLSILPRTTRKNS